ncbi:gastric triacylglycerol lipase [Elysia marginata]|uniref:Gastric triacylglycerol lipase n=1 Tax=Elysia marginata TaxID=1093978 RepID=A0AAV4G0M1_9GAST|nr:gastric triacylglycerol lipase [Elysia marginata]
MARYDVPAMLDFITKETGENELSYVGYSQGTTIGFAALAQNPRLADKVKLFVALAPVGRVANITSAVRLLLPLTSKPVPPQYDLSLVKTPVAIFRGGQDALADAEDIRWLLPQLNVVRDVSVGYYNHMDFIAAPDAPDKIYRQLTELLLA